MNVLLLEWLEMHTIINHAMLSQSCNHGRTYTELFLVSPLRFFLNHTHLCTSQPAIQERRLPLMLHVLSINTKAQLE